MTGLKFILKLSSILLMVFIWNSCENDIEFTPNQNPLEFSKDTVFLDTVFTNINSCIYGYMMPNTCSLSNRGEITNVRIFRNYGWSMIIIFFQKRKYFLS